MRVFIAVLHRHLILVFLKFPKRRFNNVSAISGFCEKCNKFRKQHCDGSRNTCMSILFDTIEALQAENEQLQARVVHTGVDSTSTKEE